MTTQSLGWTGPWLRLVQLAAVLLVVLKLIHLAAAGVFMDEAYYWMWGQHPALSYYDHPPLNAWLLALSSRLFGWNMLALRLPVALTFFADIAALYLIARRVGGSDWSAWFWVTLLTFMVVPAFWIVSGFALPDHVLVSALLYAIYFFHGFFADRAGGGAGRTRDLLLGTLFLGLAALAKYNAAFLGLGVAAFVVLFDRALLAQARLWLAGLLALALQLPVIAWNVAERFASWGFILGGRHNGIRTSLDGLLNLLVLGLLALSPFLLWPIVRFALGRGGAVKGDGFARVVFLISTVAIVAVSAFTQTLFHWNLVAYVAMLPFLGAYIRPRWLMAPQALWGTVFAAAMTVNYALVPVTDVNAGRDVSTAWSYGWREVVDTIGRERTERAIGFIAAADYTTASLLGFALGDPNVTSLSDDVDQYDFWFEPAAHAGEDAILYGDRWRPIPDAIAKQFDSVERIASFDVSPWGTVINRQIVYIARGFRPDG